MNIRYALTILLPPVTSARAARNYGNENKPLPMLRKRNAEDGVSKTTCVH